MLIDLKQLREEEELYKFKRHEDKCSRFINEDVRLEIDVQMGALKMGESIHYSTTARWHLHDIIVWALRQTGPADLYFCTYAIKEFQARLFSNMQRDQLIRKIYALVDYRAEVHDAQVVQLLKEVCEKFGTMRTHAKLVIIRNEDWAVVITTSANLTQNTSGDVGVISCDTGAADFRIDWLIKNINDGTGAK
ncbi:MAG: hypothetical protein JWO03_2853 [Bacteroidetes bacterium]|nr:hypothetical protein [Bacteroidota bacterium]